MALKKEHKMKELKYKKTNDKAKNEHLKKTIQFLDILKDEVKR